MFCLFLHFTRVFVRYVARHTTIITKISIASLLCIIATHSLAYNPPESNRVDSSLIESSEAATNDSVASEVTLPPNAPKVFAKCIACHGADGQAIAPGAKGQTRIAGLRKEKIIADLKGYRAQFTDNGGAKSIMYIQAQNLSDDDIRALADYISRLPKYTKP